MPITEQFLKLIMEQNASLLAQNVALSELEHACVKECPLHGGSMQGTFPDHVKATVQYGSNLQALVVALNTVGAVSVNRTREILSNVSTFR